MTAKGFKTITIREESYTKFQDYYQQKKAKFVSFISWSSRFIMEAIEADIELSKHMPYLELNDEPYDNTIPIIDRLHGNKIFEVQIQGKELHCLQDNRDDCIHVGACFAIRKTAQVLKEHGFNPPKAK